MNYLFFYVQKRRHFMPKNQFQRCIFALLTVIVTVHAYVFFSLYVVNGNFFSSIPGATGVLDGINKNGGVMMFGETFPIWAVVLLNLHLHTHWNSYTEAHFHSSWQAKFSIQKQLILFYLRQLSYVQL